jgi:2-succinyl-5-enolpyruvyl-6-hydroxy-3-cyclohexene-1-carboxylate synthase
LIALACVERPDLACWTALDERSAGFFALGMAKESGGPAAVIATSGTAAANLLPAIVEAAMAHVPLIAITADRPHELHGWGSLQTIPQRNLYGQFSRWSVDLGLPEATPAALAHLRASAARAVATAARSPRGPVHLNAPFREPLAPMFAPADGLEKLEGHTGANGPRFVPPNEEPAPKAMEELRKKLEGSSRGLIVCGPRDLDDGLRRAVSALSRRLGYPVFADAASQLRFGPGAESMICHYDLLLRHPGFAASHRPQIVLRFGGPLVSKVLQGWLDASGAEIVSCVEDGAPVDPFHSARTFIEASAVGVCDRLSVPFAGERRQWADGFEAAERTIRAALEAAFAGEELLTEPRICREVTAALPPNSTLFVSSSMPIRDVDAFGGGSANPLRILANRGTNGIDGSVSTALGAAASSKRPTVLLTGDLALLYDLGGLLIAAQQRIPLVIVVINNSGGGIFSFLPIADFREHFESLFAMPQAVDLSRVAQLFGARHYLPTNPSELRQALTTGIEGGLQLIEVRTSRQDNPMHHRQLYQRALDGLGTGPWE